MSRNLAIFIAMLLSYSAPAFAQTPEPINAQNELAYRAALGRADDIKLMINQGANPNGTNKEGVPLLLVAAGRKDDEAANAVRALLEGGANVNSKDSKGQTALYYAARNGNKSVVELLLKRKIDYYSLDKNGDIARTIAFRAGYADIVQLMDNFVKQQTLEAQRLLNNKDTRDTIDKQEQIAQKKQQELLKKQKKERERELKEYRENVAKLPEKIHDLSYTTCAFQYWSFVREAKQTIPLTEEQLDETIAIHKNEAKEMSLEIMKMFKTGHNYVNQVINPSKQRIFNELHDMPSRTYRKENGVGTVEDVEKRCEKIATSWEIGPPKKESLAANRADTPKPKEQKNKKSQANNKNKRFPKSVENVPLGR